MKLPAAPILEKVRQWLTYADEDLQVARHAFSMPEAPPCRVIAFHAQQCAEKAMKAVLTWHQVSFKKTHDLDELKQMCLPLAEGATTHLVGIGRLSQYAWRFRYPGAPYSPERPEAEEAQHAAGQLLDVVAPRLESQFGE